MHIYLDESGDLGFCINQKRALNYFVIALLVCDDLDAISAITNAISRTQKNKLHTKRKRKSEKEIKGWQVPLEVKAYFYKNAIRSTAWKIYSIILDKNSTFKKLKHPIDKHRTYNVVANYLLKQVNFSSAKNVNLFVDQSKNREGIIEFNDMLRVALETTLPLNIPLHITHIESHKNYGIQAVDLFCWGIFRKYAYADEEWYEFFKSKIVFEQYFLEEKKTDPMRNVSLAG